MCDIQLNNLDVVSAHDWLKRISYWARLQIILYVYEKENTMKSNIPNFLNQEELLELAENVKYFRAQNHMSVKQLAAEMQRLSASLKA